MQLETENLQEIVDLSEEEMLENISTFVDASGLAFGVFRVILSDDGKEVLDSKYKYVNQKYCDWAHKPKEFFATQTFRSFFGENLSKKWFTQAYEAAILQKTISDKLYDPVCNSYCNYIISPVKKYFGYFVYAFFDVDSQAKEIIALEKKNKTATLLLNISKALSGPASHESAIQYTLECLAPVFMAERLFLYEIHENKIDSEVEVCKIGVASNKTLLVGKHHDQNIHEWNSIPTNKYGYFEIDVDSLKDKFGISPYDLKKLDIKTCFGMPLKDNSGKVIAYLGADNYQLNDEYDLNDLFPTLSYYLTSKFIIHNSIVYLHNLSHLDSLTGIYNRIGYLENAANYMKTHDDEPSVGIVLDIDDFKFVNDLYGHNVGDKTLQQLANNIAKFFNKKACYGRTGGDEFCVLLQNTTIEESKPLIEQFSNMDQSFFYNGKRYSFTISMGYAQYPEDGKTLQSLNSAADSALYDAKLKGKNNCVRYTKNSNDNLRSRLGFAFKDIANNLPIAILIYSCQRPGKILYANDYIISLFECDDLEDFLKFSSGEMANLIYEEDREFILSQIEQQVGYDPMSKVGHIIFRAMTKKGKIIRVLKIGRRVTSPYYGDLFYSALSEYYEDTHW